MTRKNKRHPRSPVRRFPRIPTAEDVGQAMTEIWRTPEFLVRQTDSGTEFVFRLGFCVPERIREKELAVFTMLFSGSRSIDWERELQQAYARGEYKGTRLKSLLPEGIRRICVVALSEIFERAKTSGDPYAERLKGEQTAVVQSARGKRLPKPVFREKRASRLRRRYNVLLPKVKKLWKFVKQSHNRYQEASLLAEVRNAFQYSWIVDVTQGEALQNLPNIPAHDTRAKNLGGLKWTPRQLAVGIIYCEEHRRRTRPFLKASTILRDYLYQ